jgi:DNA-binding LacI/PurR family transcriptional regulator
VLHALHDLDVPVPGRVSVIGFDDIPGSDHFVPPLTTIRQDFDEVGRQGLQLLVRHLEADGTPITPPELIAPILVERSSTARPSG